MARKVGSHGKGKPVSNPHTSAAKKLAAVSEIPEPRDINWQVDAKLTTYNFQGKAQYDWDISKNLTDIRVLLDTTQASTIEIDLDDSDYQLLEHPLFAHWAFNIQDVSLSSSKKFKTSRLTNSTNNAYLGDDSDLEWVLGQRPIDFTIGEVVFRLCGLTTSDTVLTLTLEDRVASFLRDKSGFKTVRRGSHTRAQFVAMLCREARVPFWIPEINEAQPVATSTSSLSPSQDRQVTGKGLSTHEGLTVKGSPMTPSQMNAANVILDVAAKLNAPKAASVAMVYAATWESGLTLNDPPNTASNGHHYGGVLAGDNAVHPYTDSVGMAKAFLVGDGHNSFQGPGPGGAIAAAGSITNPIEIAVKVEVPSIWPSNSYAGEDGYPGDAKAVAEAEKIVENYGSFTGSTSKSNPTTTHSVYSFTRGPNEDSYDCIQRLASEVAWYAFVRQNRLWYVSGNYLFQQDPQMRLERGKGGIDVIDPNLDMGARDSIAQCTVLARTDLWAALPGMIVQVNKRGPATGKWFVSGLQSHPEDLSQQATITLQKPVPKRSEPAATDVTQSAGKLKTAAGTLGDPTGKAAGLVSPFTKAYTAVLGANTDMGVDFGTQQGISVGDPILAIGDCTLETIVSFSDVGYQPGMFFKFVTPVGKYWGWYVAEQLTPAVKVHSGIIKAGTVVAHYAASGTGIEIGWAAGPGQTATKAFHPGQVGGRHSGSGTTDGNNFFGFLVSVGAIRNQSSTRLAR